MALVAFDTFTLAQEFEKAGFLKEQIAVLTKAFTISRSNSDAVSQVELREHKTEVKSEIKEETTKVMAKIEKYESTVLQAIADLRKDIDAKFELQRKDVDAKFASVDVKFELQRKDNEILRKEMDAKLSTNTISIIKWMAGLMLTQVGLVFTILKLFVLP